MPLTWIVYFDKSDHYPTVYFSWRKKEMAEAWYVGKSVV